ncbi:MAG: InlB B-repeat-containing protein [Lachnospiraceae bacterium]|nr:InlB B-repeat-containing protein [Lachnospiraceae bacterium]
MKRLKRLLTRNIVVMVMTLAIIVGMIPTNNAQAAKTVTITYDLRGGTWRSGETKQTYTYGVKFSLTPPVTTYDGFSLAGWNTKSDGTGTMYQSGATNAMFSQNTTLYAIWKGKTYTISYDGNGGIYRNGKTSQNFTYGTPVTLIPPDYTKQGFTLSGWKAPNGKVYKKGDKISFSAANVKLTAVWTPNTYTITYKTDGYTLSKGTLTQNFVYGTAVKLNAIALKRSGYIQIGWTSSSKDKTKKEYELEGTIKFAPQDIILYPVWQKEDKLVLATPIFETDLRKSIKDRNFVVIKGDPDFPDGTYGVRQGDSYYADPAAIRRLEGTVFFNRKEAEAYMPYSTCGAAAAINTYLYLSGQRSITRLTAFKEYRKYFETESKTIDDIARYATGGEAFYSINDYLEKRLSSKSVKAVWVGGDTCAEALAKALLKNGALIAIGLGSVKTIANDIISSTKTYYTKDEMLRGIEGMLSNDIPVIMSFYNPKHPILVYERQGYNFVQVDDFGSHYFVVTATYKCGNYTFLEIASWGKKLYIDFNSYFNYRSNDIFSSYSRIVK